MPDAPNQTLADFLQANIDLASGTLRIALLSSATAYTFDADNHNFVADVLDGGTTAQEYSGSSGYTGSADRQTLSGVSVSADDADDEGVFDADDVAWTGVDGANDIQGWVLYLQVGGDDSTPGDDPLVLVEDDDMSSASSSLPLATNGSDVVVEWAGEGIINSVTP